MASVPPSLPIRVNVAHKMDDDRVVAISTDGEIVVIESDLQSFSQPKIPFPASITNSVVIGNKLIATWLSHEFREARMACVDLDNLEDGISKSELRLSQSSEQIPQVSGALWSKSLNAEPLAMVKIPNGVAFVLWKRGIYAITVEADELWRSEHIVWDEKYPRFNEIISMNSDHENLYIWSKGGGWKILGIETGDVVSMGKKEFEWTLKNTHMHETMKLFLQENNKVILMDGNELLSTGVVKGPASYTIFDQEMNSWRIAGWRQEMLLGSDIQQTVENSEILVFTTKHDNRWLNLANSGEWTHSMLTV